MIYSNQTNSQISKFRRTAILKILSLDPKLTKISRSVQFFAITLLDEMLLAKLKQEPEACCPPIHMILPFCLTCIKLACKFLAQTNPKIAGLSQYFQFQGNLQNLTSLCLSAQSEILLALDFIMPTQTFYTHFEIMEQNVNLSKRQAIYFLKLFMVGVQYSTELSQNPEYGKKIFENIFLRGREDQKIASYIHTIKEWNKNQTGK